jgi:hypothetical protein
MSLATETDSFNRSSDEPTNVRSPFSNMTVSTPESMASSIPFQIRRFLRATLLWEANLYLQ